MRKLKVFDNVSLDGYFTDANSDMSWAHAMDPEFQAFVSENSSGDSELVFGRKTYDQMAGFWPTAQAAQMLPVVAKKMNGAKKVVFSRTLDEAKLWSGTRLAKGDLVEATRALKAESGPDLVILGSGSIVAQLTSAGLIDSYQLVVVPIVLGSGRTLFDGVTERPKLELEKTRSFSNGNVVLWYARV